MLNRALKQGLLALPGVGVSFLPKLTCPLCWPAYAGILTTLGLGFLISARYLLAFTLGFLLVSVSAVAFCARERRGYGPSLLGLLACVIVLLGKFSLESRATCIAASCCLSLRPFGIFGHARSALLPGDRLVQLSAKEMRQL